MSNFTTEYGQTFRKIETLHGFNIWFDREDGEYVVSPTNPSDEAAYFTDDKEDARGTAKMLSNQPTMHQEAERLSWEVVAVYKDGVEQQVVILKQNRPTFKDRPYLVTTWSKDLHSFSHSTYDLDIKTAYEVARDKNILMAIECWVSDHLVTAMVNDDMTGLTDEDISNVEQFADMGWYTGSPDVLDFEPDFCKCEITGLASDCILVEYRRWA